MNLLKSAFLLLASAALFSSCSVYYTTSQVDNSLKSSINQTMSSIGNLEFQINQLESKYNEIYCDNKPDPVKHADQLFLEVKSDMKQVDKQVADLKQEYVNFQTYTQGKDKIVSGTPEFDKLKTTRSNMKSKMEDLQGKCNQVVSKCQNTSNYITQSVVPSIQMVNVADYQRKFEKSIGELNTEYAQLSNKIQVFNSDAQKYIESIKSKDAAKVANVASQLSVLNQTMSLMNGVKNEFTTTFNNFKQSTLGKKTINSCSKEWTIVVETEKSITTGQNNLNQHAKTIEQTASQIQALIK